MYIGLGVIFIVIFFIISYEIYSKKDKNETLKDSFHKLNKLKQGLLVFSAFICTALSIAELSKKITLDSLLLLFDIRFGLGIIPVVFFIVVFNEIRSKREKNETFEDSFHKLSKPKQGCFLLVCLWFLFIFYIIAKIFWQLLTY